MPIRCKICGKGFIYSSDAVKHLMEEHNIPKEHVKGKLYHTNPGIEKRIARERERKNRQQLLDYIKTACLRGYHYPSDGCQCPVCGGEHTKSYTVYYHTKTSNKIFRICRNCFKILTSEGPQSVYSKSVYDGDYESNK